MDVVTVSHWQRRVATVVLVLSGLVLLAVLYLGYRQDRQGVVIQRVEASITNQQEQARSTECAREVTSAGEIAQLEALDVLAEAFLDLTDDNVVGPPTVAEVEGLRAQIADAQDGYGHLNERCPVPDAEMQD